MRSSPLRLFKGLWSRINSSLPIDRRESQDLLNTLKKTFRNELDSAYPPPEKAESDGGEKNSATLVKKPIEYSRRALQSPYTSTSDHIESIVNYPLLLQDLDRAEQEASTLAIKRFHHLVANGIASPEDVSSCLGIVSRNRTKNIGNFGAGKMIWEWLESAGNEVHSVLGSEDARKIGICLTAEGRKDLLFKSALNDDRSLTFRQNLLVGFVDFQSGLTGDFNHMVDMVEDLSAFAKEMKYNKLYGPSHPVFYAAMKTNGTIIARSGKFTAAVYDGWISSIPLWVKSAHWMQAILLLSHPTSPSATAFVDGLKEARSSNRSLNNLPSKGNHVFRAVSLMVSQQKYEDALWVLDYFEMSVVERLKVLEEQSLLL